MKRLSSLGYWVLFLRGWRFRPNFAPLVAFLVLLLLFLPATPSEALLRRHLGYGAFVANIGDGSDTGNTPRLRRMGFGYMVVHFTWSSAEPKRGKYDWRNLDNILHAAETENLKLILRVTETPRWARKAGDIATAPPRRMWFFRRFMKALAGRARGKVVGYVIWNEPNLPYEWGNRSPSPRGYVSLLKAAYRGVKAGDPQALVVTAGMATTGGGFSGCGVNITAPEVTISAAYTQGLLAAGAMNDLQFICRIYRNGGKDFFDALGSHPYGFAYPPRKKPSEVGGLAFRRVEQQRKIMKAQGDRAKPVWVIEFGWVVKPSDSCRHTHDWDSRWWQVVSQQKQADYLVNAYRYAHRNWPWMGVMSLFNLDFGRVPWYDDCQPMRYYSLLKRSGARPAYWALKAMRKYPVE